MATISTKTWQDKLADTCKERNLPAPIYNIVSDRRGGRTAWSATVTITSQNIAARYWYDGQYLNNAKEDAAEVAFVRLNNPAITSPGSTPSLRSPAGFFDPQRPNIPGGNNGGFGHDNTRTD